MTIYVTEGRSGIKIVLTNKEMKTEKKLREAVLKGLKQKEFPVEVHSIIVINHTTNEIKMNSKMPMENNIAFMKYVKFMEFNK